MTVIVRKYHVSDAMDALGDRAEQAEADQHYWQLERFRELGYPRHLAEILVLAHADWHQLKHLLDRGCPPDTALEIVT